MVLALVFTCLSGIFGLIFFIDCIRYRREINDFVKYGVLCGAALLVLDTSILLLVSARAMPSVSRIIAVDLLAFIRIVLFTCMGMYCAMQLGLPSLPVLRRLFGDAPARAGGEPESGAFEEPVAPSAETPAAVEPEPYGEPVPAWEPERTDELIEEPTQEPVVTEAPLPSTGRVLGLVAVIVAGAVLYSVVLFLLTSPQPSAFLRHLSERQATHPGGVQGPSLLAAVTVLEFAFAEELIFRLGIQTYLARQLRLVDGRYWIAIVLSSLFWSLAHANILEPGWVKIAQVFPPGLALGWLVRRAGAEACILVHGSFNPIMMCLAPYLIR